MKKYIILTIVLFLLLFNINIVLFSVKDASVLFFNKIFISIFPFIILNDILIYYNYPLFIKRSFIGKIISKVFNIDHNLTTIFILSILSSHPNNAIYVKNMLDKGLIDINEANKILAFTYFPSLSFVLATIGIGLYKDVKIGIFIFLTAVLNNILIGLFLKNKCSFSNKEEIIILQNDNFFEVLKSSILKSFNSLYLILGNLIIFTIILNIFKYYFNGNEIFSSIICGILELTNGVISVSKLTSSISLKLFLTSFIINFGGLSILFQSFSILSDYDINIKKIITIKLLFSLISSSILHIFFCLL